MRLFWAIKDFCRTLRLGLFLVITLSSHFSLAQKQNKKQAEAYYEQAVLILESTKARDDARGIMVMAADLDTTSLKANFEAARLHMITIGKELAVKYFLRVYRQNPTFRFDIEYWIGNSYQLGLDFDRAVTFYKMYINKLSQNAAYQGLDKVTLKEVESRLEECKNGKEFFANPQPYTIKNIGSEINSEYEDYAPILNYAEDEIVFTTRRKEGNSNENVGDDNKPYEDIFTSFRSKEGWRAAKNIGPIINKKYNESSLSFSPDGKKLFVFKDEQNGDIYFTEREKNGSWSTLKKLPGIVNSPYRESSISISEDEQYLYFSSDRPGGFGGSDIYVSKKEKNGIWSNAKNLGPIINTDKDEDGPFIDHTQKTLYFSSRGHKNIGGFDIFKANLINLDKNEWSKPENLGYPINTPDDDIYFVGTKNGNRWYYSSVRKDGLGYSDIYVIETLETPQSPSVTEVSKPTNNQPNKQDTTAIKYRVKVQGDGESNPPINAKVKMKGSKDNNILEAINKGNGVYEFVIRAKEEQEYKLSIESEGFFFQNRTVRVPGINSSKKNITNTIEMKKLTVGTVSVLRNIYFDFNQSTFKAEAYEELDKLKNMMKQNENLRIEISGHTDYIGSKEFNTELSKSRANAVKSFLVSKGIAPNRVTTIGAGEDKPLASNDDEQDGRMLNRRVELKILDK